MTDTVPEKRVDEGDAADAENSGEQPQSEVPPAPQPPAGSSGNRSGSGRKPLFGR
jgi:hypothetical protein